MGFGMMANMIPIIVAANFPIRFSDDPNMAPPFLDLEDLTDQIEPGRVRAENREAAGNRFYNSLPLPVSN